MLIPPELTKEQLSALPFAVDGGGDGYRVINAAPDSSEYDGITEPGSPWDEECDRVLAALQKALPRGWVAAWCDNDIRIEWSPEIAA